MYHSIDNRGFLLFCVLCLTFISEGRELRCAGSFSLGKRELPASMDLYGSRLLPERMIPEAPVRMKLWVSSGFSPLSLTETGGKIIRSRGAEFFVSCRSESVEKIAALPGVLRCKVSRTPFPLMDSARVQCRIEETHGARPGILSKKYGGRGVLAGIIDTEFDTRHPAFLDSAGATRFIAIWDQYDSSGARRNVYGYGTIKNHGELLLDTSFGLDDNVHGTHTASTMAGSERASGFHGAAPEAMLIGVRYGGSEEISDALGWIFSIADSLDVPCVINMSLGIATGPHDGTSVVDRTIDSLSGPGRVVVGAAGNDGGRPLHIRFTLDPGGTRSTWILPSVDSSDGRYAAYLGADFWGEPGMRFTGEFSLMDRRTSRFIKSGNSFSTSKSQVYDPDTVLWIDSVSGVTDTFLIQYAVDRADQDNGKPHMVVFAYTENPHLVLGVHLTNPGSSPFDIHGWNVHKEELHGLGVQGYDNGDTLFTVNELGGTAKRIITVGAYTGKTVIPLWNGTPFLHDNCTPGDIFVSSGVGPTVDGRVKPDITAPGWSVVAAISRRAPRDAAEVAKWPDTSTTLSRYSGSTGTSMACPIVAGIVAMMLEVDPDLTPEQIRSMLCATALRDGFTGELTTPSNKWGYGKINAEAALAGLEGIPVSVERDLPRPVVSFVRYRGNHLLVMKLPPGTESVRVMDMRGCTVLSETALRVPAALPLRLSAGIYTVQGMDAHGKTVTIISIPVVR